MDATIGCSCSRFITIEKSNEIESFFNTHHLPSSKRRISQLIENMKTTGNLLNKIKISTLVHCDTWK